MPSLTRIYETILYAADINAATSFYVKVLGLRLVKEPVPHAAVLRMPDGGVLIIFNPAESRLPGRDIPSHGYALDGKNGMACGHIALSMARGERAAWLARLAEHGVAIEHEQVWEPGGTSIYIRDPAGNSVELVDGEVWEMGFGDAKRNAAAR